MSAILDLPFSVDLIVHAFEQEKEQFAWELWKSMYPNMMIGFQEFVKFEDYKNKLFTEQQKYSKKTKEEIEEEMLTVVAAYEGR